MTDPFCASAPPQDLERFPTLALIPAKRHSEGCTRKNWKPIAETGDSCVHLAMYIAWSDCDRIAVSSDGRLEHGEPGIKVERPPGLPDTMLAVVQDALEQVPGDPMEIIVLLQPSSPLRTAATVRTAIDMVASRQCSSVVSVSPAYPPEWTFRTNEAGYLEGLDKAPTRRQDIAPAYKRDGVVYAFRRWLVRDYGTIYGPAPLPLFTPPEESLSIDTPEDWDEAVRRLKNRHESDAALSTGNP